MTLVLTLVLPEALRTRIEEEGLEAYPDECCGLVEGRHEGGRAFALALHPARNLARAPGRFEIHPEDHFAALKRARDAGHALIGCYHSHPNGRPWPSVADREGAGEDGFLWLIAAIDGANGPVTLNAFAYSAPSADFSQAALLSEDAPDKLAPGNRSRV